jgi:uncharacterized protein
MIPVDTNILLPAVESGNSGHPKAAAFPASLHDRQDVAIRGFFLPELFMLLRNPSVLSRPPTAGAAPDVCEAFHQHPRWQVNGYPPGSRAFHDRFWPKLREDHFARRRACDRRAALALLQQGTTDFATVNQKDFRDLGFKRVWIPLAD